MNAEALLLSRLANVRQFDKGWRADCPAGHESRGALSIGIGDDGRVLLHCFAGCRAPDVLVALGLSGGDLFPERLAPQTPEQKRQLRRSGMHASWAAALGVLAGEATVCEVATQMILCGDTLTADDIARVRIASQRIHDCREVLRGS